MLPTHVRPAAIAVLLLLTGAAASVQASSGASSGASSRRAQASGVSASASTTAWVPPTAQRTPATTVDTVWYITNRTRDGDEYTGTRGALRAGFRTMRLAPLRHDEVNFELRLNVTPLADDTLTTDQLIELMRTRVAASTDGVLLLHVHGYATSWNRATREAVEMKQRGGYTGPMVVFAWPAHTVGVTWPSPQHVLSRAYWQDAQVAAESAPDLARVIGQLADRIGAEHLAISAHSMGNQVLTQALADSALAVQLHESPLRALVFASADVDLAAFRDTIIPRLEPLARNMVMYAARDDRMLRLSQVVHDGRPRAGQLNASAEWPDALHVVDMTDGRSAAWWLGPFVDSNHAFRRDGTAMVDLFQVVLRGAPPECRETLGIANRDSAGMWRATDAPLPPRPWMSEVQRRDAAPAIDCLAR
jgi:esterase/lipase superfamily enzyme